MKISQSALTDVLAISTASRGKEWELALLFVRLFCSLDVIVGPGEQAQAWLTDENLALNARPMDLLRSAQGMVNVVGYQDAYRGRI